MGSDVRKGIFAVVSIAIVTLPIYAIWYAWREMEDAAYESCIASVMSDIHRRIDAGSVNMSRFELPTGEKWKKLSDADARVLLSETTPGDCGRTQDITRDRWGRNVHVALRNSSEFYKVGVWSDGGDGITGTDDDLVAPWGRRFLDGDFREIK
jgi:hypothetical protein